MFQTRKEHMSVERNPTAFGDLRGWIDALAAHGELQEIDAQVDWNIELGTIMRLAQGPGTGKALLFNNIKDYNTPASRCRRIFGSALNNYRRIAMMFGLPPDTHPRELVKIGRTIAHRQHPSDDRPNRAGEGEHHHRQGYRPLRPAVALLEQARWRTLSPDLRRLRHQGPRRPAS